MTLTREELTNKLFPYHGLIPTDAMNQIEANRDAYWREQMEELITTIKYVNEELEGCGFEDNWAKRWLTKAKQTLGEATKP